MSQEMIKEVNSETGEEIIRPMTEQEIADRDEIAAKYAAKKESQEQVAAARASVLQKLGLTAEEAAVLLG
jgi:sugar-specific transcriptional regulator TrmB